MPEVVLGLGSNLGQRLANLMSALARLEQTETFVPLQVSSIVETDPYGGVPQGPFLNLCVRGDCTLTPPLLLAAVKAAEQAVGRTPSVRWGPREIDIDILLYGDAEFVSPDLTIPHPEFARRNFVLFPLLEVLRPDDGRRGEFSASAGLLAPPRPFQLGAGGPALGQAKVPASTT